MTADTIRRLDALAGQLTEILMTAAICAQEIHAIARTEIDDDPHAHAIRQSAGLRPGMVQHHEPRPLLDESTLSVTWKSKTLHLGHTLAFWLLARLARHPNQYVTHLDLLRDVWDDGESLTPTSTIRSLVRELRRKLRCGGMSELAIAIRGHNGRYILEL